MIGILASEFNTLKLKTAYYKMCFLGHLLENKKGKNKYCDICNRNN